MKLQSESEHPHGLSETDYDSLFTKDKHIIFGFHGYQSNSPSTYRRTTATCTSGATRKRTITTAFDMSAKPLDRFHLVQDVWIACRIWAQGPI